MQALLSLHVVPSGRGEATHAPVAGTHDPTAHSVSSPAQLTAVPRLHESVCRLQVSTPLHALPSLQSALEAQPHVDLSTVQPPCASVQASKVQAMPSLQVIAVPPHLPAVHLSVAVHTRPSLQSVPSAAFGVEHVPVAGLHVPAAWQASMAEHTTGLPPLHAPAVQISLRVHASLSLHAAPSALAGLAHIPLAGSHAPTSWHSSSAVHTTGLPPWHAPVWHESVLVHAFPSLHNVPSLLPGLLHAPELGLHAPTL